MSENRKTVRMLVTVTVPDELSEAHARREVRTLINDHSHYLSLDEGDIKVRSVKPAPKERKP